VPGRESFEGFGGQHPDPEAISLFRFGGVTSGGVTSGGVTSSGVTSGGVTSGGVTSGGVTSGGVTSGFRKRRRCTEAASVTPSPLVFRPTRNQDSRRRRRRRRRRCRQITLFLLRRSKCYV